MEAIRNSFAPRGQEDHPHQTPMGATDVTVNRKTISEMIATGPVSRNTITSSPADLGRPGTQGRLFYGPASSAYQCSSRSLPSLC
jgi:hypothetical protein